GDGLETRARDSRLARRSRAVAGRFPTARHRRREVGQPVPRHPHATRRPGQGRAWSDGPREEAARPRRISQRLTLYFFLSGSSSRRLRSSGRSRQGLPGPDGLAPHGFRGPAGWPPQGLPPPEGRAPHGFLSPGGFGLQGFLSPDGFELHGFLTPDGLELHGFLS